jgi:hypothetical protein
MRRQQGIETGSQGSVFAALTIQEFSALRWSFGQSQGEQSFFV